MPSGNVRKQVYIGTELVRDKDGRLIIDEKTGKPKTKRKYAIAIARKNAYKPLKISNPIQKLLDSKVLVRLVQMSLRALSARVFV